MKAKLKSFFKDDLVKRSLKLIVIMFIPIALISHLFYLVLLHLVHLEHTASVEVLAVVLNSLVAAAGFAAIYVSVNEDKEIKKYEFIADYNFNFLTKSDFTDVERKLESCYQKYNELISGSNQDRKGFMDYCDELFGTDKFMFSNNLKGKNTRFSKDEKCISKEYQEIINYLVYLESLVPLLQNGQLSFRDVDNLFGYRYFIAMNNPVLQKNELIPEQDFYKGCIGVYNNWKQYRVDNNIKIPLPEYDFDIEWKKVTTIKQE